MIGCNCNNATSSPTSRAVQGLLTVYARRPATFSLRMALVVLAVFSSNSLLSAESIVLQSTTSTANSGLYDHLLPTFQKQTGINVRVVAVGTGQAIRNAQNCDGDVLLVHAKAAEDEFVAAGYGVDRRDLMYNDFVIVGPQSDPAGIRGSMGIDEALQRIAAKAAPFASRGDDSGTHKKELTLWQSAGVDALGFSGKWYRETGSGMGATLNVAVGMNAYAMTDRATWITFANKGNFDIVVEGDDALYNQYGIIRVNDQICKNTQSEAAQNLIDWLLSAEGQQEIASYRVDEQQLFFPNAQDN